jgi:pimeloyl-ACP methyl ester carboxylesterase
VPFAFPEFFMTRTLRITVALALIASACTATTTSTTTEPPITTQETESTDTTTTPQTEAGPFKGVFVETDCPFTVPDGTHPVCGRVDVPEDPEAPDGPTISLAVAVFVATGADSQPDPVIYLDGGPGGRTLATIQYSFKDLVAPFLDQRDVIVYDQRGVGFSEPNLGCPEVTAVGFDLLDDDITDTEHMAEYGNAIAECHDRVVADGARTRFYNSAASAADLASLRLALGYSEWNLFGISYGTRLALTTMRDHPEGIRSVVIDGVVPPQIDTEIAHPAIDERVMSALWSACETDSDCNTAFPNIRADFVDFTNSLNQTPVLVQGTDWLSGDVYDVLIDGDGFYQTVLGTLYSTSSIGTIPDMLDAARDGNFTAFESMLSNDLTSEAFFDIGQHLSVRCHDETPFNPQADVAAAIAAADVPQSEIPSFYNAVCAIWDDTGKAGIIEDVAISSDIPTLIVSGTLDPATPPSWAAEAAKTLSNSFIFEFENMGHGVIPSDACPMSMALAFVRDPSTSPDDSCNSNLGYPRWILPTAIAGPVNEVDAISEGGVAYDVEVPETWDSPFDNVWIAPGLGDVAIRIDIFDKARGLTLPALLGFLDDGDIPLVDTGPITDGTGLSWIRLQDSETMVLGSEDDNFIYAITFFAASREQTRYFEPVILPMLTSIQTK